MNNSDVISASGPDLEPAGLQGRKLHVFRLGSGPRLPWQGARRRWDHDNTKHMTPWPVVFQSPKYVQKDILPSFKSKYTHLYQPKTRWCSLVISWYGRHLYSSVLFWQRDCPIVDPLVHHHYLPYVEAFWGGIPHFQTHPTIDNLDHHRLLRYSLAAVVAAWPRSCMWLTVVWQPCGCVYLCTIVHICDHVCTVKARVRAYIYIYVCVCVHIHVNMYLHIYIYIYICI